MENEIVLFTDGALQLEVPVTQDGESVWLSANQMAQLFDKDETNIRKHINNIFKANEADRNINTQKMRVDGESQRDGSADSGRNFSRQFCQRVLDFIF